MEKLKELVREKRLFTRMHEAEESPNRTFAMTPIALAAASHLDKQLLTELEFSVGGKTSMSEFRRLIEAADEFLAIFEKK